MTNDVSKGTVIHYEGGAEYYKNLKSLFEKEKVRGFVEEELLARSYIKRLYRDSPLINEERIELWSFINIKDPEDCIRYANLYTYVLLCGIMVPYCNWIYDTHYFGPKYVYTFDAKTNRCDRELRTARDERLKFSSDYVFGVDFANSGKDLSVFAGVPVKAKSHTVNRPYVYSEKPLNR